MKTYTMKEMEKILKRNGFEILGWCGRGSSHKKYERNGVTVVLNKNLHEVVANRIIKENRLEITK